MMKNALLKFINLALFLILATFSYGQFGINSIKSKRSEFCFSDKLKEEDYTKLKKSITYFVCSDSLLEDKENLQTILNEAWDYNEIVVIAEEEVKDYINKKNCAFLSLGLLSTGMVNEVYYELWMVKDLSKDFSSDNRIAFARINIHFLCEFIKNFKTDGSEGLFKYMATEGELRNIKPGILANYLKFIEGYLKDQKSFFCHDNIENLEELKNLKEDTLFITDNIKVKHASRLKYSCETEELTDFKKIMSKYPYPYAFISYSELNEKIIRGDKFYYAICIKSNYSIRHVSIFNSRSAECVYNRTDRGSIEFESEDFNHLKSKIGK
jgi:hypothetical protein